MPALYSRGVRRRSRLGSERRLAEQLGRDPRAARESRFGSVEPLDARLVALPAQEHGAPADLGGEVDQALVESEILVVAADLVQLLDQVADRDLERADPRPRLGLGVTRRDLAQLAPVLEQVVDDAPDERQGAVGLLGRELAADHAAIVAIAGGPVTRARASAR